jgi:hypothetical protein
VVVDPLVYDIFLEEYVEGEWIEEEVSADSRQNLNPYWTLPGVIALAQVAQRTHPVRNPEFARRFYRNRIRDEAGFWYWHAVWLPEEVVEWMIPSDQS